MIRIGIDVGGTNTDAVIMNGSAVLAGVKAPTTADVMSGVIEALDRVMTASGLAPSAVDVVMILVEQDGIHHEHDRVAGEVAWVEFAHGPRQRGDHLPRVENACVYLTGLPWISLVGGVLRYHGFLTDTHGH